MNPIPHPPIPRGFDPRVGVDGGHEVLHWLIPLVFLLILVGLVIWAVLRLTRTPAATAPTFVWGPPPPARTDPAVELARSRYARGEIPRDEFVQLSADLGAAVAAAGPFVQARDDAEPAREDAAGEPTSGGDGA